VTARLEDAGDLPHSRIQRRLDPGQYAQGDHQIEGIIGKTQISDIGHANADAIFHLRLDRQTARERNHGGDNIRGMYEVSAHCQRNGNGSCATTGFEHSGSCG
jgi:hypothetical protein